MSTSDGYLNRLTAMNAAREKLDADSDALVQELLPVVHRFNKHAAAYREQYGKNTHRFWENLGIYNMPWVWQNVEVTIDFDGTSSSVVQLRVEDRRTDDVDYYNYPWALFDDPEVYLDDVAELWDAKREAREASTRDVERSRRHAQWLALNEEFGDKPDVPGSRGPLVRSAFDKANPDQS